MQSRMSLNKIRCATCVAFNRRTPRRPGSLHDNLRSHSSSDSITKRSWKPKLRMRKQVLCTQVIDGVPTVPCTETLFSGTVRHKSAINNFFLPLGARSRRASSLAPGPDTPVTTPLRDILHGSETGQKFSWRATAAVLQARARRFSSSSAADRRSTEFYHDHDAYAPSHAQRIDGSDSTAQGYADMPLHQSAQLNQQRIVPKTSHGFDKSTNLTPQSVISAVHDRSAHSTPSDVEVCLIRHQAAHTQRLSLDQSRNRLCTPAEYAVQFNSAAQFAAAPQSLRAMRSGSSVPSDGKSQHRIRRALSTIAKQTPSLSSAHDELPTAPSSNDFHTSSMPSASSHSWAAKQKSFQRMVPHSGPSIAFWQAAAANEGVAIEGQHRPAPFPSNELARQEALDALHVLHDPPAEALHDVAACAASAFQVPVVVITLIGDDTVWCQVSAQL